MAWATLLLFPHNTVTLHTCVHTNSSIDVRMTNRQSAIMAMSGDGVGVVFAGFTQLLCELMCTVYTTGICLQPHPSCSITAVHAHYKLSAEPGHREAPFTRGLRGKAMLTMQSQDAELLPV